MIDTSHYEACRELMQKHKAHFRMRLTLLIVVLFLSFYLQVYEFVKMSNGFLMGFSAILLSVGTILCGLFASPERLRNVAVLLVLLALSSYGKIFNPVLGWLLFFVYLTEIPECFKARWIMRQDGYPYFSERFEEQKLHHEFESAYKLDNVSNAVMPDMEASASSEQTQFDADAAIAAMRRRQKERREQEAAVRQYKLQPGEKADVMPGVALKTPEEIEAEEAERAARKARKKASPVPDLPKEDDIPLPVWDVPDASVPEPAADISETSSSGNVRKIASPVPDLPKEEDIPLPVWDVPDASVPEPAADISETSSSGNVRKIASPVPDLPKEEDIPLPVWDVPEPSFPDPVTDTSAILSDFPDIAGDIPDLPDIPDIPKI